MLGETRREHRSWSRTPSSPPDWVSTPNNVDDLARIYRNLPTASSILPFGAGRTYGDTCENEGSGIVDTGHLNLILAFDAELGVVRCQAGATLDKILRHVLPHGWVVAACPGTAHVTVGGAVAHDIHGKDQAHSGPFGCWVQELAVLRSDGRILSCSARENEELFRATIGGLGLTGLITEVELRLAPIESSELEVERRRCTDLEQALALLRDTTSYDYGLIWTDSFRAPRGHSARYLVLRAQHAKASAAPLSMSPPNVHRVDVSRLIPAWAFCRPSLRMFNRLYERGSLGRLPDIHRTRQPFDAFLFPQDTLHPSNHLYGKRGVRAHQSLIPRAGDPSDEGLIALLERASRPRSQSIVTVLKAFGRRTSPGILSFAGEGTSVALGFPNQGPRTLDLLSELDDIVLDRGGMIYPAKDGRMPAHVFKASFPAWPSFVSQVDPAHSSNFWRRVSQSS